MWNSEGSSTQGMQTPALGSFKVISVNNNGVVQNILVPVSKDEALIQVPPPLPTPITILPITGDEGVPPPPFSSNSSQPINVNPVVPSVPPAKSESTCF